MRIVPARTAALNAGAVPNSPSVMAAASTVATQPAAISMSVWMPEDGAASTCSPRTPRAAIACVAATATPL